MKLTKVENVTKVLLENLNVNEMCYMYESIYIRLPSSSTNILMYNLDTKKSEYFAREERCYKVSIEEIKFKLLN